MHTEKRFSCAECSQQGDPTENNGNAAVTFPTYALLQAHIRSAHPPQCPNCPITCSTSRELRRHLEVAHGDVSLEQRKIFSCMVPGCDRSFTKKGNLTVHIRTVHEGEKRFVCGETDLSSSKKVEGWTGEGCGKRYGSKLALEEHIRTAHLGFQNAKAERRQRLGHGSGSGSDKGSKRHPSAPSTLAALTGEGYAEETGRRITCFFASCPHRFHRDYDLWVHMTGKHGCSEDEIQNLFLQRALLADGEGEENGMETEKSRENLFGGIYGLEFDTADGDLSYEPYPYLPTDDFMDFTTAITTTNTTNTTTKAPFHVSTGSHRYGFEDTSSSNGNDNFHPDLRQVDIDPVLRNDNQMGQGERDGSGHSMIPSNNDDMALIDPVLTYNMMDG